MDDIRNLILIYECDAFQIVENSQLNVTLRELVDISEKTFLQALQNRITQLLAIESIQPPADLLPIPASHKILALLGQLLSMDASVEGKKNIVDQVKPAHTLQILIKNINLLINITDGFSCCRSTDYAYNGECIETGCRRNVRVPSEQFPLY